MRIHILGICGTFMAGIAALAKQLGHDVIGSDKQAYPPMSTQLEEMGITLYSGYDVKNLDPVPDLVIIGNALSRGNVMVEAVLNAKLPYTSGPAWLADAVLCDRWVIAIAGTHGKTTTSSLVTWLLECGGKKPGFLIGGVPQNFGVSARLGESNYFVIEADEYDSAFFDKRSKFIHYHPRTLIMNNLEFDHADIFSDLKAIQQQFQFLLRTVPGNGLVIYPEKDQHLQAVIDSGCWTPTCTVGSQNSDLALHEQNADGSQFTIFSDNQTYPAHWHLLGEHNVANACAALAAAKHVGVDMATAVQALTSFENVKKRLEIKGTANGITVYDDFAHHPTAIQLTLEGLRRHVGNARIFAVLEFSSYTLRAGVMQDQLANSFNVANGVYLLKPAVKEDWGLTELAAKMDPQAIVCEQVEDIVARLVAEATPGDHILVMGKTDFGDIHQKLLKHLAK